MYDETTTAIDWKQLTQALGKSFAERASLADAQGTFVFDNYTILKEHRYFSAAIPESFGGGGLSHGQMCDIIRQLAHYCGSTALAFSMHQHLVAAAIWRNRNKGEAGPLLEKIVKEQLVLVSTGARDWLESNGDVIRTDGGYLVSGKKHFASQSIAGDMAITSAPYAHPTEGWQVLHFAVPLKAKGVSILDDWDVMGMRATGSQTIVFDKVFVPDAAVALARPRQGFPPVWDVAITVAMPLIMSAYVGLAEQALEVAVAVGKKYERNQKHIHYIVGQINNAVVGARAQWQAMITLANNIDFKPSQHITVNMLSLKTNVADACIQAVNLAMEGLGGQSFYRHLTLERIFRDVQAAQYHPLPKWEQLAFTGERLLGED